METDQPDPTETDQAEPEPNDINRTEPVPEIDGTVDDAPVQHVDITAWQGRELIDRNGDRIGTLETIYFDIESDTPQFGTVKEGFLGRHLTFVPLTGITIGPDNLQIPATSQQVKDAPNIALQGDELSQADEAALYHHYQLNYTPSTPEADAASHAADRGPFRNVATAGDRHVREEPHRVHAHQSSRLGEE